MSERFQTPTTALPPARKAMQPNIFLSSMFFRSASISRMRAASAWSKAIVESPASRPGGRLAGKSHQDEVGPRVEILLRVDVAAAPHNGRALPTPAPWFRVRAIDA